MDRETYKPNHIEDYLVTVRVGQWFGWSDSKNKIYANLIVLDGGSKPTESEVNAGLLQCNQSGMRQIKNIKHRE